MHMYTCAHAYAHARKRGLPPQKGGRAGGRAEEWVYIGTLEDENFKLRHSGPGIAPRSSKPGQ